MDLFDILELIGGLCLFLFGMNLMGAALEKRAGHGLTAILGRLTNNKMMGFLTGLGVTAIIQSSSATTVMVVGFVNSGIMTLKQAINVIMGANVGTTVTAWLLSLTGVDGDSIFVQLLKPTSFTPILALIGIVLIMMPNSNTKKKDTATILLGFATLMFGMDIMSGAVAGLKDVPEFRNILTMFSNPVLGVLAGAILTAIIQSSSASVGILQALSSTGAVSFGAVIPIIMGQNIGTCVTALISSVGTNRNARRTSVVHLSFNVIGTIILLALFTAARAIFDLSDFVNGAASEWGIAVAHSAFNILCTAILLPASGLLEKLSYKIIPEPKAAVVESRIELDERLMTNPSVALNQCRVVAGEMAAVSMSALRMAINMFEQYDPDRAAQIREYEDRADHYEDILGSYLVKLNGHALSAEDNNESAKLLHMIGELERISDHAVNILEAAEEMKEKGVVFSGEARAELDFMLRAVNETVDLALISFEQNDLVTAARVEPLEQIVDVLKAHLRSTHIVRLQKGDCTIEAGFIWSDLLTDLERVSDHCSNIAGCVLEMARDEMNLHGYLQSIRHDSPEYAAYYKEYSDKYLDGIVG